MYSSVKNINKPSSSYIRKTFIDYYVVNHGHNFVRSSPVVPFCDPTVAFVNSGMNQFKSIFLGTTQPDHKRVCNSQKCVRVGGKHNDLSVVGKDGYHHTFFEMLGNWSFGDYFKRDACEMAFELLRGPFQISPEKLYVTYFAGDKVLGLPADLECFDIWRKIGFPASRIIPFGSSDNFWEMGSTGPCGPCTEIHIDHRPGFLNSSNRAKLINAGHSDLTELWNLVFIQYNRNVDGSITKLPEHHVDTGMGFERLTAILQNKSSNYDTDLFTPIFDHIQKVSKSPRYTGNFFEGNTLDTDYRILADHARMVAICLADGMLPDKNQKLRRVLRKIFTISEKTFRSEHLPSEVIPVVVESLGSAYPELYSKKNAVLEIIAHEQDVFKMLRKNSSKAFAEVLLEFPELEQTDLTEFPGLVSAYREFITQKSNFKNNAIPGKFLFKLTDTYGLTEEHFQKFAEIENMSLDKDGYKQEVEDAKLRTRSNFLIGDAENLHYQVEETLSKITKQLSPTKNDHKYIYNYDENKKQYIIPNVHTKVLSILHNNKEVTQLHHVKSSDTICILTDSSNFYHESGGQESDTGKIILKSDDKKTFELNVFDVKLFNNCVVHICKPSIINKSMLAVGSSVVLEVDAEHRKMITFHHSATHLLNAALRVLFKKVTYQLSSEVKANHLKFEVGLIGKRLCKTDVQDIESLISGAICSAIPASVQFITASDVLKQDDITIVPGEIYPETNLRLVNFSASDLNFQAKELCCGTHVLNTQEIENFCITNMKQTNRARYAFTAVAGPLAKKVLQTALITEHRIDLLSHHLKSGKPLDETEEELQQLRNKIIHSEIQLPYVFKLNMLQKISEMLKQLKDTTRTILKELIEFEIKNILLEKPIEENPYILHYISSSALDEDFALQKATNLCSDRPILVVGVCNGILKARCCVPEKYVTSTFNAEQWLKVFGEVFNSQVSPPKGQNALLVCNMKRKKVSTNFEEQLDVAMQRANKFSELHFNISSSTK